MSKFRASLRLVELMEAQALPEEMMRQAAAGGLSLPPGDRLLLLAYLARREGPYREQATRALATMKPRNWEAMLTDPDCPDWLRASLAVLAHGHARGQPAAALPWVGKWERKLEPGCGPSIPSAAGGEPAAEPAAELTAESASAAEPELDATCQQLIQEAAVAAAEDPAGFALVEENEKERRERQAPAPTGENLLRRIANMSVPERVKRALIGGREERLLLARDANKVVQRAVVNSPRLTESEAELIASMRNVSDEVLRMIGGSRRWRQSLAIVRNLINNPRTPVEVGLPLIKHLFPHDLRLLTSNKNVNEMLRRTAMKLLAQRTQ